MASCVDELEWDDTEQIRECIQGTLDMNGYDAFDEYGIPCNFHPSYEYHHEVNFYECPGEFYAEYDLTSGGELVYLRLQLRFLHLEDGLKRIFHTIDPQ